MGDATSISWTDATWNPVRGCSRVSDGCRNCYAETVAARFSGPGQAYEGLADRARKGSKWTGVVRMVPEHLADPMRWKRPRRIFVNSMSDLFHESLSNEQIAAVFGVMAAAPQHTFQVLTKRGQSVALVHRGPRGYALWSVVFNVFRGVWRWVNTHFANRSGTLSSTLVETATRRTYREWTAKYGALPDERLITEVDIEATRRRRSKRHEPGHCYRVAGWSEIRRTPPLHGRTAKVVLEAPRD